MEYTLEFSKGTTTLNEEQHAVVTSPIYENQRILASAGSGKTTTITARIAYLVEEYQLDPRRILLVTFSRAAAQEMIHRVHRLLGPIPMYAGTFHSLSHQLLREHAPHLLRDQPFMDELPYRLSKWLATEPAQRWARQLRTLIVDEFQDINEVQWDILRHLYHPRATMTIVGDDAQNIYTWRGSSVDFILRFHERIARVKDYQLCRNYRSTESIVTIANSVMRFIPTLPFKERMVAHTLGGKLPEVHFFFRASDEYDWIVHSLEKLIRQYQHRFTYAVLSRYNSDLYRLEERLHVKGISYTLFTDPETPKPTGPRHVSLATIHGSKGLEWDIVFFMNLHDDVFPARKQEEEVICERRLFYVGITRAKKALFMTYSRKEQSLSRFVREIPRPFLRYHNVSSFKLSTSEAGRPLLSLEDQIRGLDGKDWAEGRAQGMLPDVPMTRSEALYPFGYTLSVPDWVRENDVKETWFHLLRFCVLRESARHRNQLGELLTPTVNETLLTLRIYREDIEFWQLYEAEFEQLAHHFLHYTPEMPPVEYAHVEAYLAVKLKHLTWTAQEKCHALIILSKLRGQLRPLRHTGFDLHDFSFGLVHHSVPTDLRPEILQSWKRVMDGQRKSSEILADCWCIAALSFVAEGRNVPLYQHRALSTHLQSREHRERIEQLEGILPDWLARQENPVFHFVFEVEDLQPIRFDLLTHSWVYLIGYDQMPMLAMEQKILLLLKLYAYEETYDRVLKGIVWWNLATGTLAEFEISSTTRERLSRLWQHLQQKYAVLAPVVVSAALVPAALALVPAALVPAAHEEPNPLVVE